MPFILQLWLILVCASFFGSCKPAGDSKLKTLDQLTGSNQKNECRGSYSDYFFDVEVGADSALNMPEKDKKILSEALRATYTAIPTLVKMSFAATVGIYLTDNLEKHCPNLKQVGFGSREIDACIERTNHATSGQSPFTLYLKADAPAIRNSLLRAFAYFLAEFAGGAPRKWSKDLQDASPENVKFAAMFESQSRQLFDAFAADLKSNGRSFPGIDTLAGLPANSHERSEFGYLLFAETFDSYFCNSIDSGPRNTRKSMQVNFPRTSAAFGPLAKIFEGFDEEMARSTKKTDIGFSMTENSETQDPPSSELSLAGGRQQAAVPPSNQPMHTWTTDQLSNYVGELRSLHGDTVIGRGPGDGAQRHETLSTLRKNADQPRTLLQYLTFQRTPANAYRAELTNTALDYRKHESMKYEGRQAGAYGERDGVHRQSWGNRGDPFRPRVVAAGNAVQDADNRTFTNGVIIATPAAASAAAGSLAPQVVAKASWMLYKNAVKSTDKNISPGGDALRRNPGDWFTPVGLATKMLYGTVDAAQVKTAREGNQAYGEMVSAMNGNYREPSSSTPVYGVPFSRSTGSPVSPRLVGTYPFANSLMSNSPTTRSGRSYELPMPSQGSKKSSQQPFGGTFSGRQTPSSVLTSPYFGPSN